MSYYDSNFGRWDMPDDPADREEMLEFYDDVQRKSVLKKCLGCGRMVKILPNYGYCDACATAREQGADF